MEQRTIQQRAKQEENAGPSLTGIPIQMRLGQGQWAGPSPDGIQLRYVRVPFPPVIQREAFSATAALDYLKGEDFMTLSEGWLENAGYERLHGLIRTAEDLSAAPEGAGFPEDLETYRDDEAYYAIFYLVNSLKITGDRVSTMLRTADRRATQGDHTIADIFIREHQMAMVRNAPLCEALVFYIDLFNEVKTNNQYLQDDRTERSSEYADNGIERANRMLEEPEKRSAFTSDFQEMVKTYYNAYARSAFSTQGEASGGHGERGGAAQIRNISHGWGYDAAKIPGLLDMKPSIALQKDAPEALDSITTKFYKMLNELYLNRQDPSSTAVRSIQEGDGSDVVLPGVDKAFLLDTWATDAFMVFFHELERILRETMGLIDYKAQLVAFCEELIRRLKEIDPKYSPSGEWFRGQGVESDVLNIMMQTLESAREV